MTTLRHLGLIALALCTTSIATGAFAHGAGHDTGFGAPGRSAEVERTVQVSMTDRMRFVPSRIEVRKGQTVRFVVRNEGKLRHEFVLGSAAGLKSHAEVMKMHPDMQHREPNMITLEGGQAGEVIWRFTSSGQVGFACLQAGHFDAGMKGRVDIRKAPAPRAVASAAPPSPHH